MGPARWTKAGDTTADGRLTRPRPTTKMHMGRRVFAMGVLRAFSLRRRCDAHRPSSHAQTSGETMVGNLWRSAGRSWLQNAAEQQLAQLAATGNRNEENSCQQPDGDRLPQRPHKVAVAVVFGDAAEAGGLEDLLEQKMFASAGELQVRLGKLRGIPVVAAWAGRSETQLRRATEAVLFGHRPKWVVAAGFSTALSEQLDLGDLIVANAILAADQESIELPPAVDASKYSADPPVHVGPLLHVDQPMLSVEQKQALAGRHRALATDPAGRVVCNVCRETSTPVVAVRVVAETLAEQSSPEVRSVAKQQSLAGKLGATLGAIWRRPSSVKDLWQCKERALVASDRLGRFVTAVVGQLCGDRQQQETASRGHCGESPEEPPEESP